jgi:hypothetical protein
MKAWWLPAMKASRWNSCPLVFGVKSAKAELRQRMGGHYHTYVQGTRRATAERVGGAVRADARREPSYRYQLRAVRRDRLGPGRPPWGWRRRASGLKRVVPLLGPYGVCPTQVKRLRTNGRSSREADVSQWRRCSRKPPDSSPIPTRERKIPRTHASDHRRPVPAGYASGYVVPASTQHRATLIPLHEGADRRAPPPHESLQLGYGVSRARISARHPLTRPDREAVCAAYPVSPESDRRRSPKRRDLGRGAINPQPGVEFPPFRGRFTAWDSSRALRWLRAAAPGGSGG